jgi:hypothetical protein
MSLFPASSIPAGATGYDIDNSLRFNDNDSAYLSKAWGSAPTNANKFTYSVWVKRGNLDSSAGQHWLLGATLGAESNIKIQADAIKVHLTGSNYDFNTSQLFRDSSAWYHLLFIYDSDDGTASDRFKIYVNGVRVTDFSTSSTIPSGTDNEFTKNGVTATIGAYDGSNHIFDGLLSEVHFIDGTALDPTSFGETGTYGEWKAKKVSGLTYGTNGFYLDFKTSGTLGNDANGSNNWTTNNLASTDQMLDTPTNNFATFNPLARHDGLTLAEGNTRGYRGSGAWAPYFCTMGMTSGKWYWEVYVKASNDIYLGMTTDNWVGTGAISTAGAYSIYSVSNGTGYRYDNGVSTYVYTFQGNYEWHWGADIIIQFAYDADTGKFWMGKANTWFSSGNPSTGATPLLTVAAENRDRMLPAGSPNSSNTNIFLNFGQDSSFAGEKTAQGNQDGNEIGDFYYTPPSGFLALCTKNLPDPAVIPSEHFNTVLYTGNGTTSSTTQVITTDIQPDLVWMKCRSNLTSNRIVDAVRGVDVTLYSDTDNGDYANVGSDITAFGSTSFTLTGDGAGTNRNGRTYVAWNWKAGNATLGTGDFTQGSTASTCSRNADAGFSIVSYTGTGSVATIGHGLSKKPELIIAKTRNDVEDWGVYSEDIGAGYRLKLNSTVASASNNGFWNSTEPTTSLFTVGTANTTNWSGKTYIAYCFHSVDGYSKVGTYKGNGVGGATGQGPFVYLGFRPAYIMIKRSSSSTAYTNWIIYDSKRDGWNQGAENVGGNKYVYADSSAAEANMYTLNTFSNGFTIYDNYEVFNTTDATHVFIAFAESPFKHTNAR